MLLFIILSILVHLCSSSATVDIRIQAGPVNATVRGSALAAGYMFHGVPYAKPPIGDLRFEQAVLLDPSGLIDATSANKPCLQHEDVSVEDCLVVNILTPRNVTSTSNFATYVYIHGGALVEGTNGITSAAFNALVNRGPMVIVSINYRLGPFGYFSTRTSVVPGNMGLSDQITALQWVQKYIRFFGGNPNKVTVGGHSAGAWSASAITITRAADVGSSSRLPS